MFDNALSSDSDTEPCHREGKGEVKQVIHLLFFLYEFLHNNIDNQVRLESCYGGHLFLGGECQGEDVDGSSGVPDEEDDDGRDDEDQQEDGDTESLLLVGGLQLTLNGLSKGTK